MPTSTLESTLRPNLRTPISFATFSPCMTAFNSAVMAEQWPKYPENPTIHSPLSFRSIPPTPAGPRLPFAAPSVFNTIHPFIEGSQHTPGSSEVLLTWLESCPYLSNACNTS
uniref:Uncharacterized protein n=1 Tax=Opuntia streptacantha TaxID=393608 RepID=A0A7C9DTI0_OPUST